MSEQYRKQLIAAQHAMQTGIAYIMEYDPKCVEPKHLRVGINTALVEAGAMAKLLIKKGLITEDEYYQALIEGVGEEVERYKTELKGHLGDPNLEIKLF